LADKQGSKGQEISCKELKMADYLLPSNQSISLDEQRSIFAIRNRMVIIPSNFPNGKEVEKCPCGQIEDMKHIYQCKLWNNENEMNKPKYEQIFSDHISDQVKVNKNFMMNYQEREKYEIETKKKKEENQTHTIPTSDPLSSVPENSNG
jgi:hypothetical protein